MLQTVTKKPELNKLAYSVNQFAEITSLSPIFVRLEIKAKRLKAKQVGRRLLILQEHAEDYLNSFDDWKPKKNEEEK